MQKPVRRIALLVIVVLLLCLSLLLGRRYEIHDNQVTEEVFSMNTQGISINELKAKALGHNDTVAYNILSTAYLDFTPGEFLPIALEMANENDYSKAYFDVYSTLSDMQNLTEDSSVDEWQKWNMRIKGLALEYLLLAADRNHAQSKQTLKTYFIEGGKLHPILLEFENLNTKYAELLKAIKNNNKLLPTTE